MQDKKFNKYATKTLVEAIKLYQYVNDNANCYSRSDDIIEALDGLISQLGFAVHPDILSTQDIIDFYTNVSYMQSN